MTNKRLPAEWEGHTAILIAWPHPDTDWAYMLDEATDCFSRIVRAIAEYERVIIATPDAALPTSCLAGIDSERITIVECPTNDTWARDFGPITIEENGRKRLLDYQFNGWGLKFAADRDNLITTRLAEKGILNKDSIINRLSFALEGGSIESDGRGALMTTAECLLSPNRNGGMSEELISEQLMNDFGVTDIIMLRHGGISGDDTDSHIDTLARFADAETILYVGAPADENDPDYAGLKAMEAELHTHAERRGLKLVKLPYAGPVTDADGNRIPATYANFLITPRAVFVPTYSLPADDEALGIIAETFPRHDIKAVECSALIQQHGSLHCVTMQLYDLS